MKSLVVTSFCCTIHSYMDIYISRTIRLCVVDLEGKFQTNLQAKHFLIGIGDVKWVWRSLRIFENKTQNGQHLPQDCHILKEENQVLILSHRVIYAINVRQLKYMQHLMLPNKSKSHLKYQMPLTKLLNGVFWLILRRFWNQ